jgi:hypothetical protein
LTPSISPSLSLTHRPFPLIPPSTCDSVFHTELVGRHLLQQDITRRTIFAQGMSRDVIISNCRSAGSSLLTLRRSSATSGTFIHALCDRTGSRGNITGCVIMHGTLHSFTQRRLLSPTLREPRLSVSLDQLPYMHAYNTALGLKYVNVVCCVLVVRG